MVHGSNGAHRHKPTAEIKKLAESIGISCENFHHLKFEPLQVVRMILESAKRLTLMFIYMLIYSGRCRHCGSQTEFTG